ncbi:MAG: universal stress protein [Polyangiales bacterium]|jgi:nucleotide-binding universal stress UspA family protein
MIHFAYDGSIHGDWVARYAMRMASRLPEPRLQVLHVEDGQLSKGALQRRLARIEADCDELALPLEVTVESKRKSVAATLLALIPDTPDHYLVCGTRVRQKGRGFLADTVSEKLLREGGCQVLSVRVVQPGLLGGPRRFSVPVSGRPEGIRVGLPHLRLLVSDASAVEVLLVHRLSRQRFQRISHAEAAHLIQHGQHYVAGIEQTLGSELGLPADRLDATVVLSDDIPKEIVIHAGKAKSQLIYMGASTASLRQRSVYGSPIEQVLRNAPCDVAIYGTPS